MATLLLTLVAHRSIIAEQTKLGQRFTTVDNDFIGCLFLVLVSLLLVIIFNRNPGWIEGYELYAASIELAVVLVWGLVRLIQIMSTANEISQGGKQ